jgi:hypothetical protein
MLNENTPERRREIAVEVNGRKSKSGKTTYPQWINSTEELVEQYRAYAKADLMDRYDYDNLTDPEKKRQVENLCEMYADLTTRSFEHDLPAMLFLFKRYLTQR